jgi:penicillin-binding protein 2
MIFRRKNGFTKKNYSEREVTPDEILVDTKNVGNFNEQQFEGVFEIPIARRSFIVLGAFFVVGLLAIGVRLWTLQIVQGADFFEKSEENRLNRVPIFSERGVIFDRYEEELAWNSSRDDEDFSRRSYITLPGFSLLGFVRYPERDRRGFFWRYELEGRDGVEQAFQDQLKGTQGIQLIETDAHQSIYSESLVTAPVNGENVTLSLDARVQTALYQSIKGLSDSDGYLGGGGVIMDVRSGELVAVVSYPEFSPAVLTENDDNDLIEGYFSEPGKPFLNRVLSGLYTPGSIVKPFIGIAALDKGVITERTKILSTGKIEVPNRYDPENPAFFHDWKPEGHGWVDISGAIADSVNTFFYSIGGGYENQEGIGIKTIDEYMKKFGFEESVSLEIGLGPEGVIPSPDWKRKVFDDGWRLGDTYITSIGQFGFQVTPLQVVRAMGAIANSGKVLAPTLLLRDEGLVERTVSIDEAHFLTIRESMRETVTAGTAWSLDVPYIQVAAKTGTAQVGGKKFVNSWSTGFFPYEEPQYAYAIVMERGPKDDARSASWAIRDLFDWMSSQTPEYFDKEITETKSLKEVEFIRSDFIHEEAPVVTEGDLLEEQEE